MGYKIKQIISKFLDANCYLIEKGNKYVIIDPCVPVSELKRLGVNEVSFVLVTHGHVDHIYFVEEVVNEYNCTVYFSEQCIEKMFNDQLNLSLFFKKGLNIKKDLHYEILKDGDIVRFEDEEIKCIYTPGHSSCSMCYLLNNDLFTGDTLFDRSVGRTDLYSGNSLKLIESLKKIVKMNIDFTIYPGHDSISTISEQLKYNRYLKNKNVFIK